MEPFQLRRGACLPLPTRDPKPHPGPCHTVQSRPGYLSVIPLYCEHIEGTEHVIPFVIQALALTSPSE